MKKLPPNLCILPFIHLSSKPPGQARYCCFSPRHLITDENDQPFKLSDNIDDIWNSKHAREFRMKFINNERPAECEFCWREEDSGKNSKRQKEIKNYGEKYADRIEFARDNYGLVNSKPVYLDLRLGNKCNLKCRTCNTMFSSFIEKEVQGWSDDFFAKVHQFKAKENINDWYQTEQFNENMESLLPTLEHVYITGGEPSIIPELLTFINRCIELGYSDNIIMRFNTNLASYKEEFFDALRHFKTVNLGPSIDAIGDKLTYMRHPLQWDVLEGNFHRVLALSNNVEINVNCTVSVYNILYLNEVYSKIYDIANTRNINFIFEIAHEPDYLNFNILTSQLKTIANERLETLLNSGKLTTAQYNDITSIMKMMNVEPLDILKKQEEFREYTLYIDSIRNENFIDVFPELKGMIDE